MLGRSVCLVLFLMIAGACQDQRSENYVKLQSIKTENWTEFSRTLSIKDRLALYDELYHNSGFPRNVMMADSFTGDAEHVLDTVLSAIKDSATFDEYIPIVYALGRGENWSVCDPKNLKKIQTAALRASISVGRGRAIAFGDCRLFE